MIKNPPIIKKVVQEMGGTIEKLIPERGYFYIKLHGEKIFVSRKFNISNSLITGREITLYKDLTYILMKQSGLPTPKTACFYKRTLTEKLIEEKLKLLKFPVIIKDAQGSNSKGIFANIRNVLEAKAIILKEIQKYNSLVVQEMVFGHEYRVLVLKDKIIGALELIPPRIFGNGKSTIEELIEKKQEKTDSKTAMDDYLANILSDQGYNLKNIPEKGKEIFIKKNSSLAEGGETRDVTDIVDESIKTVCIQATKVSEKYLAGLDVMCDDISKNVKEQTFNIIEINGKPDVYIHYNPTHGKTRNVIREIINFILELRK